MVTVRGDGGGDGSGKGRKETTKKNEDEGKVMGVGGNREMFWG